MSFKMPWKIPLKNGGKNGQFGIQKNNIEWHLDNKLIQTLTWEEVYEISDDIIRSKGKKNYWVYKGEEKD